MRESKMAMKFCEVCRAPASVMPCRRCIFPGPRTSDVVKSGRRQTRPSQPLLLEGKYRVGEEIGRGGMGTVFRAVDVGLDREVAIKFLLPEIQHVPEMVERFRTEARAMAAVQHSNVVQIYARGRYGEADFLVTELIEGQTMGQLLDTVAARNRRLGLTRTLSLLDQAAAGLAAVHRAGVVHRDIKPGNIMIEHGSGRVVLMDFGIGHRPPDEATERTLIPGGTPAYMAPEVVMGDTIVPRLEYLIDIYSFGVLTFEVFTGALPFTSENWITMLQDHLASPPPRPSTLRSELPPEIDDLVLRCLAKRPDERPQSMAAFRASLLPLMTHNGVSSHAQA
jgi:serine/threonine-protein kinase